MHIRHVEPFARRERRFHIEAAAHGLICQRKRLCVLSEGAVIIPPEIARELIEYKNQPEHPLRVISPAIELACRRILMRLAKATADLRIKGIAFGKPFFRPGTKPEIENIARADHVAAPSKSITPAIIAGVTSSRILPDQTTITSSGAGSS